MFQAIPSRRGQCHDRGISLPGRQRFWLGLRAVLHSRHAMGRMEGGSLTYIGLLRADGVIAEHCRTPYRMHHRICRCMPAYAPHGQDNNDESQQIRLPLPMRGGQRWVYSCSLHRSLVVWALHRCHICHNRTCVRTRVHLSRLLLSQPINDGQSANQLVSHMRAWRWWLKSARSEMLSELNTLIRYHR